MALSKVLVANRGEIAVRVIRAAQSLGIETVLAVSEADRDTLPARMADRAICIGPPSASQSYLNAPAIVATAMGVGADAVHPGYGFLAEDPGLAEMCADNGIKFVGPSAEHMRRMGNKLEARALAERAGVPTLPGSETVRSAEEAEEAARRVGLPVMLKAAAGGGGRGMKMIGAEGDLAATFAAASAEARTAFGDDTLYLERFIPNARHVEVQVVGDGQGGVIHLGERDCSLQRRHQKVVEEAPAPDIADDTREQIRSSAVALARNIGYENAGTVEFLFDQDSGAFFFLEMNTRIQVEHPVTEMITGVDLVAEQFRVASGGGLSLAQDEVSFSGHAIECRITAELPDENFRPNPGRITVWRAPQGEGVRLDTHCYEGYEVPLFYDSLLAKLIVHAPDRALAVARMKEALHGFVIEGVGTTVPFLAGIMAHADFAAGPVNTRFIERLLAS